MRLLAAALLLSTVLVLAATIAAPQTGDEAKGKELFQRRCGGCHATDQVKEGPRLRGVYGRRAGTTTDFQYSVALKTAQLTWNDALLDKWLTDTESLVPDNDMTFRVPNPSERRDIIAFLKSMSQ
ncbi:c-type cytochrome [Nevskia soli]|uniref:c-type cytochrome n=1 Tax=Nevskia soli TaxID=418856 RepID=UPI0015D70383|nr:c-type cytochrome [Nevskia soli]